MRVLGSFVLVAALMSAAVPASHADDSDAIAAAYGDLSVFVLNVAAGHDGVSQNTDNEQFFKNAFAQQFAAIYPSLSPDLQQSLAQLPQLDEQTQQVWAGLPAEQRGAIRDEWAAQVETMEGNVTCAEYDALVRANLVPDGMYHAEAVKRLGACWRANPELAKDNQGNQVTLSSTAGGGNHALYMSMMNASMMNFAATMNVANNFGDGQYTYSVR